MNTEFRFIAKAQIRAKRDSNGTGNLEGYAAVFDEVTEIHDFWGSMREVIRKGAFARSIKEGQDVRCLMNHDANVVLGRTKSGTLELSEDDHGLKFRCEMPDTQAARDLYTSIERGDIDQCSFAFVVRDQKWDEQTDPETDELNTLRELLDVDLYDVSPVTYPAYAGTAVSARSMWPEGIPTEVMQRAIKKGSPELKAFVTELVREELEQRASAPLPAAPTRANDQRSRDESEEAQLAMKQDALSDALAQLGNDKYGDRLYYGPWETYSDHIIAVQFDDNYDCSYFSIPYTIDDAGAITFGEPKPVELDWVPSDRSLARLAESREAAKAFRAAKAIHLVTQPKLTMVEKIAKLRQDEEETQGASALVEREAERIRTDHAVRESRFDY